MVARIKNNSPMVIVIMFTRYVLDSVSMDPRPGKGKLAFFIQFLHDKNNLSENICIDKKIQEWEGIGTNLFRPKECAKSR